MNLTGRIFQIDETVTFLDGTKLTKRLEYAPKDVSAARTLVADHHRFLGTLVRSGTVRTYKIDAHLERNEK